MLKILNLYKYLFYFSGILLIAGIVSLSMYGLKLGIDFKGGTITELKFSQAVDTGKVKEVLNGVGLENAAVQTAGETGVIIKTEALEKQKHDEMLKKLKSGVGEFAETRYESIGPTVGTELARNALYQLILVSLGIIFYIAYAFRKVQRPLTSWQFGISAIIALLHDLFIVLGIFSLLGYYYDIEIDSLFVTAMLTVLGFSVHDTIVVFDRVRENLKVYAGQSVEFVVNHSITQTIARSLNTSLTVLFVLLAMLLFGGETIRYFVLALFIGVFTGTYSSIFVASPILVLWQKWRQGKQ
ncbi:MAG TPA: protein translocase subunit SecF [Patescibacteria group bacterium]|nr:protein translocase subunit SecF [Patescibacteria group bacterium]